MTHIGLHINVQRVARASDARTRVAALLDVGFTGWLSTTHAVYYASPTHRWAKNDNTPLLAGELVLGERSYHVRWSDDGVYEFTEVLEVEGDDYEVAEHTFVAIRPANMGGPEAARGRDKVNYRAYWPVRLTDAELAVNRQVGPVTARLVGYHLHTEGEQ